MPTGRTETTESQYKRTIDTRRAPSIQYLSSARRRRAPVWKRIYQLVAWCVLSSIHIGPPLSRAGHFIWGSVRQSWIVDCRVPRRRIFAQRRQRRRDRLRWCGLVSRLGVWSFEAVGYEATACNQEVRPRAARAQHMRENHKLTDLKLRLRHTWSRPFGFEHPRPADWRRRQPKRTCWSQPRMSKAGLPLPMTALSGEHKLPT